MSVTPWGRADQLRERKLAPGPGKNPKRVDRHQRERLLGATVSVVAEKGYEATRVSDIVEAAGVSRSAFYKRFANKRECFVAALDAINKLAGPSVLDVYHESDGPWDERLAAMLDALATVLVTQPAVARVSWIEAYVAGSDAVARIEQLDARVERIVLSAFAESPERDGMPTDIPRALNGGLRKMIHTRLREGRSAEIPGLMAPMHRWMLSYEVPPERLRHPRRPPATLLPEPARDVTARERIVAAVTGIVAETGYEGMSINDVARRASVSLTTFYECFDGKEQAFVSAIDRGRRRMFETVTPAYRRGEDWPHAIAVALHSFFALLTAEPALARLGGIVAYEGGAAGLELRDEGIAIAQGFLKEGYQLYPETPALVAEALGATVYALMSNQIRSRGSKRLYEMTPTAIYLVLSPFVGADAACAVANERAAE